MNPLIRREILSADYARAMRRGDRAEAKRLAEELRRIVNEILRGQE